ncbi:type VI secretion system baseplate subunit TssE [Marinobacterium jannaschii]|uniref:type VI secretion system baseplate subunit TssE n=1 Tax=Marinobacterium jannaschii TaxID=64970 RepID=UPI0004879706|nr:type VI secretion system baseplate subunit TssE [Marinobacterium jannaschii]
MVFWQAFLAEKHYGDPQDALVASVQYQLTRLLNSEAPLMKLPPQLQQVEGSNLRFGLDSLQTISSQMNNEQFARQLEDWVKAFEPRLAAVQVEVHAREEHKNRVSFSLLARLKTERGSHALVFDSSISLAGQKVEMEGQEIV